MKVLITDDEPLARERLRGLLHDVKEDARVVGEASTGSEAVRLCEHLQPHVLLLDIAMPEMDGLEVARHVSQVRYPPAVIFTTAYDRYALEAFDTHAVSYLLKPIRREQLARALQQTQALSRAQLAALKEQDGPDARTRLCARHHGELELLPVASVIYFLAEQKYVSARHEGGELLLDEPLKALEEEFGQRFVRVHRNALVARSRIQGLVSDTEGRIRIRLKGVTENLEVSRRHVPTVRKLLREGSA